jgi:hypothetical protein
MSDSATIRFWTNNEDPHPVGLYLHWEGGQYAEALASALTAAKDRWGDEDYANRMTIQSILGFVGIGASGLGGGLFAGTASRGEDHPILNVSWEEQVVWTDEWRLSFNQFIRNEGHVWEVLQA